MTIPILRPLGFGETLDAAFSLYRRNLGLFLLTALIPMLGITAVFLALGRGLLTGSAATADAQREAMGLAAVVTVGLGTLFFLVIAAAVTRQASQSYLHQPTSLGDGFRAGLQALFPLLGAAIVALVGLSVTFFGIGVVLVVLMVIVGASGVMGVAIVMTVLVTLAAAVVYMGAVSLLFAVIPAVVVEGKGPVDAIARSFDLARGAVRRVTGMMVVALLITYLPGFAVMALTDGFAGVLNPQAVPTPGRFVMQQLLGLAVNVLTTPFLVSVMVLLYFDRRVRTEALDVRLATDRLAAAESAYPAG